MAILQKYLTSSNASMINVWEDGITDVGAAFACVGNKSDGTACYTLIDISALLASLPSPIAINSVTLRMPAYDRSAWGSAALTAKVSRITSAWSTGTVWSTKPTLDTGVVASANIGAIPSSSNYDYRTGYHATRWKYYLSARVGYPVGPLVNSWQTFSTRYTSAYNIIGGYWYSFSDEEQIPAYYDTYVKYYIADVTQQITDLISSGYGLAVYFDLPGPNNSRKYFKTPAIVDVNQQWLLTIDYTPLPAPTVPTLGTIGTVTDSPHTFDWSDASDVSGNFTSAQLMYEFQFAPDGTTWGSTYTTAAGVSQQSYDLKTVLSLEAGQYYYNAAAKIRVRTKTPEFEGTTYYSEWATSAAFIIDYRLIPTAPTLTPSDATPYEGEVITFTCGRPTAYNTHKANGDGNTLDYRVELASGTALVNGVEAVTSAEKVLDYTVGNLTSGKADLSTNIRARCIDAGSQVGAYCANVAFTVKRFRVPIVQIVKIDRSETAATVHILIADTGYGASQYSSQINKIQYDIGAGYVDATLGSWTGLANSFTISGLDGATAYGLNVRAVNNAPDDTELSDKTGDASLAAITEFRPTFAALKDNTTGVRMAYARSLIVGDDDEVEVKDGGVEVAGWTGVIWATAASAAPSGWLLCDGAAVSRITYARLFTVIGTTYGAGDGSTTFNLPNLKGRAPVGLDATQTEFDALGKTGGAKTATVEQHRHAYYLTSGAAGDSVLPAYQISKTADYFLYTAYTGSGASHNNLQPYIVLNYIIKT